MSDFDHLNDMTDGDAQLQLRDMAINGLKCDAVRFSSPNLHGWKFLVVGYKRDTHQDKKDTGAAWVNEHGVEQHFEYLRESVVASGSTWADVAESLDFYVQLSQVPSTQELLMDPKHKELLDRLMGGMRRD